MVQLRAQQDIEARQKAMQSLQMLFNLNLSAGQVAKRNI
jgi:glutamyl-tRNA reductase